MQRSRAAQRTCVVSCLRVVCIAVFAAFAEVAWSSRRGAVVLLLVASAVAFGDSAIAASSETSTTVATVSVNLTEVSPNGALVATISNSPGGATDWIALALASAPNTSNVNWIYVGAGVTNRTWSITAPLTAGTYEFRLFANDGYTRLATSPSFVVLSGNPAPVATSLSQPTVQPGSAAFSMTVFGSGFVSGSVARLDGIDKPTTFVSFSVLSVAISEGDVATEGIRQISVVNASPGGGSSGNLALDVTSTPSGPGIGRTPVQASPGTQLTATLTNTPGGGLDPVWWTVSERRIRCP